jgi:hypothetical protein
MVQRELAEVRITIKTLGSSVVPRPFAAFCGGRAGSDRPFESQSLSHDRCHEV